jgi:hypothetical protein
MPLNFPGRIEQILLLYVHHKPRLVYEYKWGKFDRGKSHSQELPKAVNGPSRHNPITPHLGDAFETKPRAIPFPHYLKPTPYNYRTVESQTGTPTPLFKLTSSLFTTAKASFVFSALIRAGFLHPSIKPYPPAADNLVPVNETSPSICSHSTTLIITSSVICLPSENWSPFFQELFRIRTLFASNLEIQISAHRPWLST